MNPERRMIRVWQVGLIVLAAIASLAASAEPMRGTVSAGVPSNPFASNYPSEPPDSLREHRARTKARRPMRTRSSSEPFLPPREILAGGRAR
jgi:hypothetical protein